MNEVASTPFLTEPAVCLAQAGGVTITTPPRLNLVVGTGLMAVKLVLPRGFDHPWHNHPAHESMGVVVRGRVLMRIGDAEPVELGPGDTWHHPVGVHHSTHALEESWVVEMHSPLREDLLALAETTDKTG